MDEPYRKAMAAIDRHLAGSAGLTPAKIAQYRAAAEKVIRAMGPEAVKRWNENVKTIRFYPDTETIERCLHRKYPDLANVSGTRGLCLRDRKRPNLCRLHLNGGSDTGNASALKTSNLYAHEFGHAIDWSADQSGPLSQGGAWREVSREEKERLREWLEVPNRGPAEDFANFAIVAWNYPEAARRHYAECWRFWSERGLSRASPAS